MRIDPHTLLFEDLSPEDVARIMPVIEDIVLRGKVPHPKPEWLEEWLRVAGYDDRQFLLVVSTSLPQRALLSIVRTGARVTAHPSAPLT